MICSCSPKRATNRPCHSLPSCRNDGAMFKKIRKLADKEVLSMHVVVRSPMMQAFLLLQMDAAV